MAGVQFQSVAARQQKQHRRWHRRYPDVAVWPTVGQRQGVVQLAAPSVQQWKLPRLLLGAAHLEVPWRLPLLGASSLLLEQR